MALRELNASRRAVDLAARQLIAVDHELSSLKTDEYWELITRWRSFHAYPLNKVTIDLKRKVSRVQDAALVVQRLKRTRSVLAKLTKKPSMRLTQMQDIGGCRAVFDTIEQVYTLKELFHQSKSPHEIISIDDYIANPQSSGYRSLHLVLKFRSKTRPQYESLLFEVQIRTKIQHSWATAVETVGAVIGQALKSSEGEESWLKYFQFSSYAMQYTELNILAHGPAYSRGSIARELATLDKNLKVSQKLTAYRAALKATEKITDKSAGYFLLVLLPEQPELKIFAFSKRNAEMAHKEYDRYERLLPLNPNNKQLSLFPELENFTGAQAVLVGAESFKSIRDSYPNYYLDTKFYLDKISEFVKRYKNAS